MDIIEELSARRDIEQAHSNYALGIDFRDPERFLRAWTPDATWELTSPKGTIDLHGTGHAEIEKVLRNLWAGEMFVQHITANHSVGFDSDMEAHGDGHSLIHEITSDNRIYVIASNYPNDLYRKVDGIWRLSYRLTTLHMYAEYDSTAFKSILTF